MDSLEYFIALLLLVVRISFNIISDYGWIQLKFVEFVNFYEILNKIKSCDNINYKITNAVREEE